MDMISFIKNLFGSLTMSAVKPNVVFVLGPPGSGKGTMCQKIVEKFGYTHLSAGELLRQEQCVPGSKFGDVIANHIKNGTIVPVEITCRLLEQAMKKSGMGKFLIDGFPRNQNNLEGWNKEMSGRVNLQFVLFLQCPEETCVDRCLKRGQEGSGRTDDNVESLRKRFRTYTKDTLAIVEYYDTLNLVKKADASPNDPEEVFKEVSQYFANVEANE